MEIKDTLNLPKTDFPMRPQRADDAAVIARWYANGMIERLRKVNQGAQQFTLHDGPPYANGNIHLGHAYNKILKDIIIKSRRMSGMQAMVTPGWDCHGLPIELKVASDKAYASALELKRACRAYAQGWVDTQRAEMRTLGVLMDWDNPYVTMNPAYEAATIRAFGLLYEKGFIERKHKSVAWCASCKTTLASAEIEYEDKKDPSVYVRFALSAADSDALLRKVGGGAGVNPASSALGSDQGSALTQGHGEATETHVAGPGSTTLVVWTTTPWTLPLNRAVMLKAGHTYEVIAYNGAYLIFGKGLGEALVQKMGGTYELCGYVAAQELKGLKVAHPFIDGATVPVLLEDDVAVDEGTACVHTAPGCGPIDYEVGVKNGLEIYAPITPDGRYAEGIVPVELVGMAVKEAHSWVFKQLAERGTLVYKTSINHSYPHCWRCRQPLIFRATLQWFISLQHDHLKERAQRAIGDITFFPERSRNFLTATVGSRWEWCVSRQRSWGVPIPALLCNGCDGVFVTSEMIERVAQGVARDGIEFWDMVEPADLAHGAVCHTCKGTSWRLERDILDVWFDSGISHFALGYTHPEVKFPADLYVEGIDQFRGWYQSSLLTSVALNDRAPMRGILSHGFTVDAQGHKMSKSRGNVVAPQTLIDRMGVDGLRLWVASIDHSSDAVVSDLLITNVSEVYRKIRNSCRFMVSNVFDFDIARDAVALEQLLPLDRFALVQAHGMNEKIKQCYAEYQITGVFHLLADYCATDLSARYFDIIKDRLYVAGGASRERRSAQTVVWHILDMLTKAIAPIMSVTAELVADAYRAGSDRSIHEEQFVDLSWALPKSDVQAYDAAWQTLHTLKSMVNKQIEPLREQGIIKHSLEARVKLSVTPAYWQQLAVIGTLDEGFFAEWLIVSQVELVKDCLASVGHATPKIEVARALGTKCPRCWHYDELVPWSADAAVHICRRCARVLG